MFENGSWNSPATIQDSGFIVNTTCWNCGGKGQKAEECSSKKVANTTNPNRTRGKWSAPRNGEPKMKLIHGKLLNTIKERNAGINR